MGHDNLVRTIHSEAYRTKDVPSVASIVDEFSMVDLPIMEKLVVDRFEQREDGPVGYLLLVGDPGQLPSVGYGAVMRDVLRSGVVAALELKTVYRQAGSGGMAITEVSRQICGGTMSHGQRGAAGCDGVNVIHFDGHWADSNVVDRAVDTAVAVDPQA